MFSTVCTTLVGTKFENCLQAESSCSGGSDILEKVKKAGTCSVSKLWDLSCKELLEKLDLFTLYYGRLRGDLFCDVFNASRQFRTSNIPFFF